LYSWITTLEERQRRAISDAENGPQQPSNVTTWLHCSVGPKIEDGEESEDVNTQVGIYFVALWCICVLILRRQLRCSLSEGLTGSRQLGSPSQILPISDVNSTVSLPQITSTQTSTQRKNVCPFFFLFSVRAIDPAGPPDDEHARALEEQWIDSLDNASTASLSQSSSSTNSSILQGIVLGFFFPLLPLFFIREPKPAAFWESGTEHELTGSVVFS
jgi:hypothetical protein